MTRLWPRTLSGQLIVVMVLSVALSQVVTLLIHRFERAHAVRKVVGEECIGRLVSAYRLTQGTPPPLRGDVLKSIETSLTRYWLSDSRLPDPIRWQQIARDHLLSPISAADQGDPVASIFANEAMLNEFHDGSWRISAVGPIQTTKVEVLDLPQWNGFGFAIALDDHSWLNMVYAKPCHLVQTTLTPGYYTALAITVAIFAGVALFIARRVSKPLGDLAKAAERLGRGEEIPPLPEVGPADVRSTIAAFNAMQVRLHRFLADRTRMLAAISHDLRTPITSLRLRTEFIPDAETRDQFTATLDEMQSMTEATLSFAKSESGSEPTRIVDLDALLESISDDLNELGWRVRFESRKRLPYPCRPAALRRAIRNVIENAVRYGESAEIQIHADQQVIEISVEDSGPGIPVHDRERVFEPFVRLESSRNRDTGGAGLGLSIARSIIRNHGGDITLSDGTAGLRVAIRLPGVSEKMPTSSAHPL